MTREMVMKLMLKYARQCEHNAKNAKLHDMRMQAKGRGEAYRLAAMWIKRIKDKSLPQR